MRSTPIPPDEVDSTPASTAEICQMDSMLSFGGKSPASVTGLAALGLARKGFAVIPVYEIGPDGRCSCGKSNCESPGKHPRTSDGVKSATKDPDQIRRWWRDWPDANVAVATGPISGVSVMDVDGAAGAESLRKLEEKYGLLPDTLRAITGSGGQHYFFAHHPEIPCAQGIRPKIDTRGDGGYVLVDPSNHKSGNNYRWVDFTTSVADPPAWFTDLLKRRHEASKQKSEPPNEARAAEISKIPLEERIRRCREAISRVGPSIDGSGGSNPMLGVCGLTVEFGLDDDKDALPLIHDYNRTMARPPWSDAQIAHKLEDARKKLTFGYKLTAADDAFITDEDDKILPNRPENIRAAFKKLGLSIRYNEFSDRPVVTTREGTKAIDDNICRRYRFTIQEQYHFLPHKDLYEEVLFDTAYQNRFHPVRDYINRVRPTWDKFPRIETFLISYGGAEDTPLNRAISKLFFVAAIRRILRPGCKFDEMLILESSQGTGKSSGISALCPDPEWFTDHLPFLGSPAQRIEAIQGRWIVEAAEVAGLKKQEIETVKAFLSRTSDNGVRLAWRKFEQDFARQCVFVGTTNEASYLRDMTGNRRFLPVKIRGFDPNAISRDRDQLWAEAATLEETDISIRLNPNLYQAAEAAQELRRHTTHIEDKLTELYADKFGEILADSVWQDLKVLDGDLERKQRLGGEVGKVMAKLGFERVQKRVNRKPKYVYVRSVPPPPPAKPAVRSDFLE